MDAGARAGTWCRVADVPAVPEALRAHLERLFSGSRVESARALADDERPEGETAKELGYGHPIRVALRLADGSLRELVLHALRADSYGHDRRADRVASAVLALDTFDRIPDHVSALDAGVLRGDGTLVSLRGTREPYVITEWAEGTLYADDLRRVAREGAGELDLRRVEHLAGWLATLHREPLRSDASYARAIRDLVGSGEGIAGIADGYDEGTPGAPRERIEAIERACLAWRHRLRGRDDRLRRTHGDFHPFNLLFAGDLRLIALDASRGCEGDPADDVAALAINYLFFGLEHRVAWARGLGRLWERFFDVYLAESDDRALLDVIAPFFAWRGLVIASPRWYPHLAAEDRDRILRFVERALAAERFDPAWAREAIA